jgi:putative photosynthetic complex assembly protein
MNTAAHEPAPAPTLKLPVAAAAVLVIAALVGAATVRLSGISISEPDAAPVETRDLRFVDRPDGSIDVFDARSQALVETVRGEAGFVRGALRGLARERRRVGIGTEPPFTLVARADGRLTLIDPSTSRRVDLEAFGPTNAAEFARMLARKAP